MAAPPDAELSLAGGALAAKAWGPPDGPPVLALHGWLDNAASFDRTAPALAAAGFRVVALDLPGHGGSAHKQNETGYPFVDYAFDVGRAAAALGWRRFRLLGHSLGAAVACFYAGVYPDQVEQVAAVEGLTPQTAAAAELPERMAAHFAARARPAKPSPVYPTAEAALAVRIAAGEFPVGAWIDGVVRRNLVPAAGGVRWRTDPRLRLPTGHRLTPEQAAAVLGKIAAPVLCVRARQGLPLPADYSSRIVSAVRDLRVVELDGGHHVHLEHPEAVNAAIVAFFRGDLTGAANPAH